MVRRVASSSRPDGHHEHGFDQAVESVATFHDLLDAVLNLGEQFAQPQLGQGVSHLVGHAINLVAVAVRAIELGDENRGLSAALHAELGQQP